MHGSAAANSASDTRHGGDLLCGACGYNLRGSPTNRCPECGQQFDPNHVIGNLVPWEQRKWTGRVRAFFRTAWMGSVRVGTLAEKINRPVNAASARWFRFWVCLVTAAALSAGFVWWRAEARFQAPTRYQQLYLESQTALWVFVLNPYSFAVLAASIVIWLIACINVVSSFFYSNHLSSDHEKRMVALSAYTSATFAWLPIALPLCAWSIALNSTINPLGVLGNSILIACWLAFTAQAISWLKERRRSVAWATQVSPASVPRQPDASVAPESSNFWRAIIALVTAAIMSLCYWLVWWDFEFGLHYTSFRWSLSASVLTAGVIGASLAGFWFNTMRLYRLTMGASLARTMRAGALIALTWLALGVMIIGTTQALSVMVQVLLAAS
jgi:hypothetical protein